MHLKWVRRNVTMISVIMRIFYLLIRSWCCTLLHRTLSEHACNLAIYILCLFLVFRLFPSYFQYVAGYFQFLMQLKNRREQIVRFLRWPRIILPHNFENIGIISWSVSCSCSYKILYHRERSFFTTRKETIYEAFIFSYLKIIKKIIVYQLSV